MKNFWETYPRQLAHPNRIFCKDAKDFMKTYNELCGSVDKVYVSLYKYNNNNKMEETEIDVVGLDMDSDKCYDTMKEVHNKLLGLNIRHQVLFSTRGFWIFAYAKHTKYAKNIARGKVAAMQDDLIEGTSAYFGKSKDAPMDQAIRGDVERLCRMPTSYDKGRGRYAILLSEADIALGYDGILALSTNCDQRRRFQIFTFCKDGNLLDPEKYESKSMSVGPMEFDGVEFTYEVPSDVPELNKKIMEMLPEYMRPWVTNQEAATWEGRSYVTLYLREKGFSIKMVKDFLKPFYIKHLRTDAYQNNWNHYEAVKTAELIFQRKDLKMPNFDKLWKLGLVTYQTVEKYGRFKSPAYK